MANIIKKVFETDVHLNEDGNVVIYQHDSTTDLHGESGDSFVAFPIEYIEAIIAALTDLK